MSGARRLLMAAGSSAPAGETAPPAVDWEHMYFAGSEDMVTAFADGADATAWYDQIASDDMTGALSVKVVGSDANFNGFRSLRWTDDGTRYMVESGFTAIAQPFAYVIVGKFDKISNPTSNRATIIDSNSSTAFARVAARDPGTGVKWSYEAGGTVRYSTAAADTNPHLFMVYFNGASSRFEVDNTSVISGSSPGTDGIAGLRVGYHNSAATTTWRFDGRVAFVGIYAGDPETDPEWANFVSWVSTHYGI